MNTDLFNLQGKTIVVTGGTGHLGTAICNGLASFGANVMVASRNKEECIRLADDLNAKYSGEHRGLYMDILNTDSIHKTYEEILGIYGKIDVLINNANINSPGQLETFLDEDWEKGIDGTINSVFRTTRAVLPHMIAAGKGNIINIASMYGVVSPNPEIYGNSGQNNPANYGAGKAAIIQFTRYIACHYGLKGIRANAVSPGPFPNKEVQKDNAFIANLSKKTALGRIGHPDELRGIIILLASDGSSYLTGQNICIDGGWTSW